MNFTNDFFLQAQGVIERVFRDNRPKLVELHGIVASTMKEDKTVVTEQDKRIEKELTDKLLEFDSKIGIEGEEQGIQGSRETYWLIDPIDGTESFIRGLPFVRNMATLIDGGEPVFALIFYPIQDELYVTAKGEGAYCNGKPISVSKRPIERSWLELNTAIGAHEDLWRIISELRKNKVNCRKMGEFITVANGSFDALLRYKSPGGPWDYAPQSLFVQEAGGRVANIGSDKYTFRKKDFLAANPVIFDELMEIIVASVGQKSL